MRVLLIEDDSATAQSIELMLKSESFNVYTTDLGEEGVDLGKLYDYDIILLDLNLPDMSGFEVLRSLRVSKVKTPILILSGLAGIEDKVKGLGFGADDYMTKPFHKDELIARIHAIVRRSKGHAQSVINTGDLTVNLDQKTVEVARRPRAPDRQGIPDAGAALAPQGHHADQGDVPQSSLRRHGRARTQDHRRVHLQAPQEAGERLATARTTSRRCGAAATCCASRARKRQEFRRKPKRQRRNENPAARRGFCLRCTARRLLRVVEDDAQRMAPAVADAAHAVAHVDAIDAARALHRPVMHRKDHRFALAAAARPRRAIACAGAARSARIRRRKNPRPDRDSSTVACSGNTCSP